MRCAPGCCRRARGHRADGARRAGQPPATGIRRRGLLRRGVTKPNMAKTESTLRRELLRTRSLCGRGHARSRRRCAGPLVGDLRPSWNGARRTVPAHSPVAGGRRPDRGAPHGRRRHLRRPVCGRLAAGRRAVVKKGCGRSSLVRGGSPIRSASSPRRQPGAPHCRRRLRSWSAR